MKVKTITQSFLGCILLAASSLTVHAADRLLIVGDGVWGGWTIDNSIVMMKNATNPDLFTATVNLNAGGDFKFLTETWWGALEYRAGDTGVTLTVGEATPLVTSDENSNDNKFQVSETANYDIVCDLTAKTVTVTKADYQANALKHTALWLIGSATPGGWNLADGAMLTPTIGNPTVFAGTVDLVEGEMKIAVNSQTGYGQTFYQRDTENDAKMVFGGDDNKWNITQAGKYDVTVDVVNMTISIIEAGSGSVSSIESEANAETVVYDLRGNRVSANTLCPGIYIEKCGSKTRKIMVK
ncbi:MAG: SusF/SusE family outer membrane protein [Candidatus Limisoma sp.]